MKEVAAIILAGGEGTRLNKGKPSHNPKVLFEVGGKPLILYSLETLKKIGIVEIVVVIGYKGEVVRKFIGEQCKFALQEKPLGTGDATLSGLGKVSAGVENVMVIYGADIYSEKTLRDVLEIHSREKPVVTFVTKILEDPAGFGRIIRNEKGRVSAIVEEKVATGPQKKIKEVNDGCYIFKKDWLSKYIKSLPLSKVKEYFLTDLVEIAIQNGSKVSTFAIKDSNGWIGVDSPGDIKYAERRLRGIKR